MPALERALTKLEEMRDFHMENAINSSMPKGQKEGGSEGGKEGKRIAVDISKRVWDGMSKNSRVKI